MDRGGQSVKAAVFSILDGLILEPQIVFGIKKNVLWHGIVTIKSCTIYIRFVDKNPKPDLYQRDGFF